MATLSKIETEDEWSVYGASIPDRCFVCNERLFMPLVFWAGCNGEVKFENGLQIWMHPKCAQKLGECLIVDAKSLPA